jgi:hypothetical protein
VRSKNELLTALYKRSIIDPKTGCLLWQGATSGQMGYGVTCWQGKQTYIHRLIYSFAHPEEILEIVRHTCDTPRCWNIEHLLNGTTADNVMDKIERGRHIYGSENYNAKFSEDQIIDIRNSSLNIYELGVIYKVTPSTIHYIRARKTWKHVP